MELHEVEESELEWVVTCRFEPEHQHVYPYDWFFGGPNNTDPRADPRWTPCAYTYYDATLHPVHTTSAPLCDDQAIDEFTLVAGWGLRPHFLAVRRPGEKEVMLPWKYDLTSDVVSPL